MMTWKPCKKTTRVINHDRKRGKSRRRIDYSAHQTSPFLLLPLIYAPPLARHKHLSSPPSVPPRSSFALHRPPLPSPTKAVNITFYSHHNPRVWFKQVVNISPIVIQSAESNNPRFLAHLLPCRCPMSSVWTISAELAVCNYQTTNVDLTSATISSELIQI
jgi:hypothetical protein